MSSNYSVGLNPDANFAVWFSEQEIFIGKLKAKDREAFSSLYKQYSSAIYGTIFRSVDDDLKARSILEETFLEVWFSISLFDQRKVGIFTWVSQIAYRRSKKMM